MAAPIQLDFSRAVPLNSQPAPNPDPGTGVTLDFSRAQPLTGATPQQPPSDEIQSNPSDNLLTQAGKFIAGIPEGIGEGIFQTAATGSDLLNKVTGMQPGAANQELHTLAGDNDQSHGAAQNIGRTGEGIAEFFLGDEGLKGMALSERLGLAQRVAALAEKSPTIARVIDLGINAARSATVGGVTGGIHDGEQGAVEGALTAGVLSGVGGAFDSSISSAADAVKAAPKAAGKAVNLAKETVGIGTDSPVEAALKSGLTAPGEADFQAPLQAGIRSVAGDAATDAGVNAPDAATSIRDVLPSIARDVRTSAQADYQALDQASGGRWQRYTDQLDAINDRLGNLIEGTDDDDVISKLEARRNEIQASQAQMIDDMKADGKVDPAIADRAAAQYRRAMALQDVGQAIRMSTKPVAVNGVVKDIVDPNGLANRLAKLNDVPVTGGPSRLVQALGDDNAGTLLAHVNTAQVGKVASLNPTGQQALTDLLTRNTPTGRVSQYRTALGMHPDVGYMKALSEFNRMTPAQQAAKFGDQVSLARQFLQSRARHQALLNIGRGVGIGVMAHETGLDHSLLHFLIE